MNDDRIKILKDKEPSNGPYVLYHMALSPRVENNEALAFAIKKANSLEKKLIVSSSLKKKAGFSKHQKFEIEGLKEVFKDLKKIKIKHLLFKGDIESIPKKFTKDVCALIVEKAFLKEDQSKQKKLIKKTDCPVWEVDNNLVVPVDTTSDKREYAARTIRPKITKKYSEYLTLTKLPKLENSSLKSKVKSDLDLSLKTESLLEKIGHRKKQSKESFKFKGGYKEAKKTLTSFIRSHLDDYADKRMEVFDSSGHSDLSPYLRYGHISPVEVIKKVEDARSGNHKGRKAFVEELLVRRELAFNFVHFEKNYDSFNCLPDWAKESLEKHDSDERDPKYTKSEFENAKTDDDLWNACMNTMKNNGYLHNALRMYWGKKVLEWSSSSSYGYKILIELNNKYFLDGRDPNSYANTLWCFGLHDRAWGESDIYGKVRKYSKSNAVKKLGGKEGLQKFIKQSTEGTQS
jgi:deoxyribodipyrimidine photo-lyase